MFTCIRGSKAPVYKPNSVAPRAKGFRRVSTGVRRAPHGTKSAAAHSPKMPHPRPGPAIPLPSLLPMNFPTVTFPPMASFPTLPTFATIAMPTLPSITMPPSFQRLMGITTTAAPKRRKSSRKMGSEEVEERPPRRMQESSER
ncbi:hypothetical protein Y032_0082g1568 [Ancylostoma ceylanicum]|uniref:Uncharacterized protein n=1 Tax=Ancylostoma ceylanicum TaxID=53326 RepID=A0A016TQU5_9BILA|nr:hypothetical protein Y032_0082g1568 [Ancylostoma ceylanicum]